MTIDKKNEKGFYNNTEWKDAKTKSETFKLVSKADARLAV